MSDNPKIATSEESGTKQKYFNNHSASLALGNQGCPPGVYDPWRKYEIGSPLDWAQETLGLTLPFSEAELKQAYLAKAARSHPGSGGNPGKFLRQYQAYKALSEAIEGGAL